MEPENKRIANELDIKRLTARVEELDRDVQRLRGDFDEHVKIEDEKYFTMQSSLNSIQSKMDQLLVEIKEPMETYKSAKYGMKGMKWIAETLKWFVPLIVGLSIGYSQLKTDFDHTPEPTHQTQKQEGAK